MSALRGDTPQNEFLVGLFLCFTVLLVLLEYSPQAFGQEQNSGSVQITSPPQEHAHSGEVASLQELLSEAEQNNPQIQPAREGWQAAKQIPSQVSTLPDPQFTVQQVNVGSPRPFAGYTNSDFAYVGLGVSQEIPYPGKLQLRGEIARRDADVVQQQYETVRRSVLAGIKS